MIDRYLKAVLAEAERVAEHHDQVARSTDSPAHEYLQYAVLRILEGNSEVIPKRLPQADDVTVGYGQDKSMFDSWGSDVEWWETVTPRKECTRFWLFYPDEHSMVPRAIVNVMAALGAWSIWEGDAAACGSYDHRQRREVHYLWPEGHPVEELLQEHLQHPDGAVAPDGGQAGDIRDRMVVSEQATQQDALEPRTRRAVDEPMNVSLLAKGGRYEVASVSGNRYTSISSASRVPVQTGNNGLPRAVASICAGSTTRSNRDEFQDQTAGSLLSWTFFLNKRFRQSWLMLGDSDGRTCLARTTRNSSKSARYQHSITGRFHTQPQALGTRPTRGSDHRRHHRGSRDTRAGLQFRLQVRTSPLGPAAFSRRRRCG